MTARVILDVESGLAPEEVALLRQLLYDALGEFVSVRSGQADVETLGSALAYVKKRYPEMGIVEQQRKADEVMLRKAVARKLRQAASDVRVEATSEAIEDAFVAGDRAAETGASHDSSPHPADSLLHHWWTRGFSYKARLVRAIEAEIALKANSTPVTPIAERTCVVLPTVFMESVEEEVKRLGETIREGQQDEISPLEAYAKPHPDRDALRREMAGTDFEYDFERFTTPKK